ncbi:MAG: chromosomal replication initiator protein DnaA [Betaproteobacteria bacterium]|nr:chromosomal replication initiator protein DnaA [Betaproteobacteria bacterium]
MSELWDQCQAELRRTVSEQQFQTWIRPLSARYADGTLTLAAPNRFVLEWVRDKFIGAITEFASREAGSDIRIVLELSDRKPTLPRATPTPAAGAPVKSAPPATAPVERGRLNPTFTFENFVTGKANQLARAAAMQIGEHPGTAYNPLFVYGGVGLGKTHLIHAIGNYVLGHNPAANIRYTHAEQYVSDVIRAYQHKSFDSFKKFYHSLDLLLIDDIQFFSGKSRTQEEFFYAFNALIDARKQVIITCDSYPKELEGIEDRLISRFGWGLTVAIEPPELEMRVAILLKKAEAERIVLPEDVAFFIATHIQSNVRELEGALKRVLAYTRFANVQVNIDTARDALKDLLAVQTRQISVENIQKTVADYYKVRVSEMFSKKRSRTVARPRQVAMALAKELTTMSLPDIGDAFGGRDHTTVLHACRKIAELRSTNAEISRDFDALVQVLRG